MMELSKNNIEDILPLTPLQAGMLYHDLLEKESHHHVSYNQQVRFRLTGELNVDAFRRAWQCLINRHAALRVVFKHDKSAEPIQIVLKERDFIVRLIDLTTHSEQEKQQQLEMFIESDKRQIFELERDIPMRVSLLKAEPQVHWFIWSFHHICLDGWCVASLQQELFTVYQQLIQEIPVDLPPAPSFSRYIKWYKNQESHQDFWRKYLNDFSVTTSPPLPTLQHAGRDERRNEKEAISSQQDYAAEIREINATSMQQMNALSVETGATISTLFHCLWGLFLAKVNETQDVVFGSVQSIRPLANSRFERLIGLCINTVPYRIRFSAQDSLADVARQTQMNQLDCLAHATMSVSDIQAQCTQTRQLFDHFIAFENYPATEGEECGREKLTEGLYADEFREYMPTSYPFHLAVLPTQQSLQVLFKYVPRKVDTENVRSIADSFLYFVQQSLSKAEVPVCAVPLIQTVAEEEHPDKTQQTDLISFCKQHASPGHTALVDGDNHYTYQELLHASHALAHIIDGKLQGDTVALYDTAGPEMLVAMFACFRLGVPYVPIDPSNPQALSRKILKQARTGLIITARQPADLLITDSGIECLTIDATLLAITTHHDAPLNRQPDADSIAYIIFTSGTTGEPKGVPVSHKALINYVCWGQEKFGFSSSDSSLLLTSFCFDLGYTAIFGSLLCGGTLHFASEIQRRDPLWVAGYLRKNEITFLKLTPSYLHMLMEVLGDEWFPETRLTRLIQGGEPLNFSDLQRLRQACPELALFNHYGPTENTIGCCANQISAQDISCQHQNIGRPASHTRAMILDRQQMPCPPYVEGELCLSGRQLMRSYLNPENNHNRLIQHHGQLVYRTGDRAYTTEDGDIIFVGRSQQSVKIDGYRVDLNAVQRVVQQYPAIQDCLVDSFTRDDGSAMIVALVIVAEGVEICLDSLRDWLGEQLPHYMHPADFIEVSRFPITTNGKLDRKTLFHFWKNRLNMDSGQTGQAPQTDTESRLVKIWEKLFLRQNISTGTSFFELGGHSIKAIICTSEIRKAFGVSLPVSQIFTHPTIADLAQVIERYQTIEKDHQQQSLTLINHAYQRILPLYDGVTSQAKVHPSVSLPENKDEKNANDLVYCLPAILGTSTVYKEIFEALKMPVRAFGFQCGGFVSDPLPEDIPRLADFAAECITEHYHTLSGQPRMMLFGYSFGAILALEVARRLEKRGYPIGLLLLDSSLNPNSAESGKTFSQMRHLPYWNKIISLFEKHFHETELRQIEDGVMHHQRILRHYLQQQQMNDLNLKGDMICIESSANAEHGYMRCFAQKTSGHCRVMSTSGDHYSMFQPPHFSGLLSNIRDAATRLLHPVRSEAELS